MLINSVAMFSKGTKGQMDKCTFKTFLVLSCTIIIFTLILAYTSNYPFYQYMAPIYNIATIPEVLNSIMPIKDSEHFMVSAFIDHRLGGVIRVISIIKRDSLQQLYCVYCNTEHDCRTVQADVQIHSDHFGFPFHVSDVICKGKRVQKATRVLISTKDSDNNNKSYLPIKNRVKTNTFKFNFTICISNVFGNYNNVLQFAQTMEMYKLLGVQHVVIYNTSLGPDLEKLLKHYETEGILEIVSWPIDKFLNPSPGWNFKEFKGDLHYYGQLVTLNECIYRHMYQSRYVLLNDIDEIIMPYKHTNLPSLMKDLQSAHPSVGVFLIENHIFPKTQFEGSGRFKRAEWQNIPGVNIMEHIYREPDRKNVYNPTKMIVNPRKVEQTSVHSTLKDFGGSYHVPFDVCRIVHVRVPLQGRLTKDQLFVDKRVWDFVQELIPNVDQTLNSSGLLRL
ncbi:beta-1,4-galactosyltransferase galt-1 isoform X12 [Ctenopharyngodon idella]|uniref:beta-1,4-galactosyltransferase galt-1 isoform X11 n=1 Tax=Ctenopharyngodon idella TaxID=7959 RepID=UPI0022313F58|nr:beta-1,4-galactosyltransferase galt-1 isoform X11 [Ctenopharyngodon idella]XP_051725602.1 beta-1,4-galactosyltransferase galt-1 isoform X12 [Ctenopharyngodon idella]